MKKILVLVLVLVFILTACQNQESKSIEDVTSEKDGVLPETIRADRNVSEPKSFTINKGSSFCGDYYEDNFGHKFFTKTIRNSNCDGRVYAKLIEEKLFRTMNTGIARVILNPDEFNKSIGRPRRYKAIVDRIYTQADELVITANVNNHFVKTTFPKENYQICEYDNKEFRKFVEENNHQLEDELKHLITKS